MAVGIISYGTYVPRYRIRASEYVKALGSFAARGVSEKTVPDFDEDTITMAREAARGLDLSGVLSLSVATTVPPYDQKVLSGTLAEMLGLGRHIFATEHTSSDRCGTEALIASSRGLDGRGLVLVAGAPRGGVRDETEHGAGAGAVALVIGEEDVFCEIEGWSTYVEEALGIDFRPAGADRRHDLGLAAYSRELMFRCVKQAVSDLMTKLGTEPGHYAFAVLPGGDGRTPAALGKGLGFEVERVRNPVATLGDLGPATVFFGLAEALAEARPGDRILLASYGAGSGSDAISLKVRSERGPATSAVEDVKYLDFVSYLKIRRLL